MSINIKELREQKGLLQKEIAVKLDISESYYCLLEGGKRRPTVQTAKKIAEVLGFDWTQFYDDDPRQNAS